MCKVAECASAEGFNGIYSALDTNAYLIGSPFQLQLEVLRLEPYETLNLDSLSLSLISIFVRAFREIDICKEMYDSKSLQ